MQNNASQYSIFVNQAIYPVKIIRLLITPKLFEIMHLMHIRLFLRHHFTWIRTFIANTLAKLVLLLLLPGCNISQHEGKDCDEERKENTDCTKYMNAYFMGLCNQDITCMYEKKYYVTTYLNCQVLYEKVPSKCEKQPNSRIIY